MPVLPVPQGHPPRPSRAEDWSLADLLEAKAAGGMRVSVCLPARDEEATVGHIVATVRRTLMEAVPLVDEVVVVDDGSSDATADAASWEGARVLAVDEILPETGAGSGKGNAMWKSLYACDGDVLCWVDADIRNFAPHFVTGLLGPLLTRSDVGLVKGFYRRPLHGDPHGGGRVTELVARPLISTLFPQLTRFVQPLAGEYAGRRDVLDAVPFVEGWGVELGLLVDVAQRFGVGAIEQVDLGVREHRNRTLDELGPQAMAILVTALRKAGLTPERAGVKELVRYTEGHEPDVVAIEVRERPAMRSVSAYRAKFGLELTA